MSARRGMGRFPGLAIWLLAVFAALAGVVHDARASMPLSIEKELQLLRDGQARLHLSGSRYRFAVFAFEDPDATGLGNALATILASDLLMNGQVDSRGILRYVGDLGSASGENQLRYFDKIEPLIQSQGVQVAVWGVVRRSAGGLRIDSYVQLSPAVMRQAFSYTFRLPREMGQAPLVHRIGPRRLLAQRLKLDAAQAASLAGIAASLDELRASPSDSAAVVATLPLGKVHYLLKKQGDWMRVGIEGGASGWQRAQGVCSGACAPFLAVSRFASSLMAYDDREWLPERNSSLADDAKAFIDQLYVVEILNRERPDRAEAEALRILDPWCPAAPSPAQETAPPPPGGAALCNLRTLATLVIPSRVAAARHQPLEAREIRAAARQLALVSQSDPRHVPTLKNLATLFKLLGDTQRAELAGRLADEPGGAQ